MVCVCVSYLACHLINVYVGTVKLVSQLIDSTQDLPSHFTSRIKRRVPSICGIVIEAERIFIVHFISILKKLDFSCGTYLHHLLTLGTVVTHITFHHAFVAILHLHVSFGIAVHGFFHHFTFVHLFFFS